jgi:hypothetical protein
MKKFKFNIEEAIEFSKDDCIEEWVHIFLKTVGGNRALSEGLKLQKRHWCGPILLQIDELIRCCGGLKKEWNIIIHLMIGRSKLTDSVDYLKMVGSIPL